MFTETVELDDIHLTSNTSPLELRATSRAFFKSPTDLSGLGYESKFETLTSGQVWVSHGSNCIFDIRVFLNNERMQTNCSFPLMENLGYCIQDAELWCKLSLSTSLRISQESRISTDAPNISILISQGSYLGPLDSTLFEKPNLSPPESILCASLERLEIQLLFNTKEPSAKRMRSSQAKSNLSVGPQLDSNSTPVDNMSLQETQCSMRNLSNLSQSVLQHYSDPASRYTKSDSIFSHPDYSDISSRRKKLQFLTTESGPDYFLRNLKAQNGTCQFTLNKSEAPERTFKIFRLASDFGNPSDYHLDDSEIYLEPNIDSSVDEDEILLVQNCASPSVGSRKILLTDHEPPPSWTDPSILTSLKRPSCNNNNFILTENIDFQNSACQMLGIVLNLIVSGTSCRYHREFQFCKLKKPHPKASLAELVPSLFSLDFVRTAEKNSRYLSTISQVFSNSLLHNSLSPGLKNKLLQLSKLAVNQHLAAGVLRENPDPLAESIFDVLNSRLWTMVHRKLNNPTGNKNLWANAFRTCSNGELEDPNPPFVGVDKAVRYVTGEESEEFQALVDLFDYPNDPDLLGHRGVFKTTTEPGEWLLFDDNDEEEDGSDELLLFENIGGNEDSMLLF